MPLLLDGQALALKILEGLRPRVAALPRPPGLAVVRAGDDPASAVYVGRKTQRAKRLGFHQREIHLPADVTADRLLATVRELNEDPQIDGILVQLPLPGGLDSAPILDALDPDKDVDGFHPRNSGLLSQGRPWLAPCTPRGVMRLLRHAGVDFPNTDAVVIGRSNIVGRPMAQLLEQAHATVTICHSRTQNLSYHVKRADVVVAAIGRPELVQGSWIRPGAVVIDVGMNRREDGTLCGDVEFEVASKRAAAITPVPGGVGPMTIALLMENTVLAAEKRLLPAASRERR